MGGMCSGSSGTSSPPRPKARAIDPLIILGLSGSGKSTFAKQMKMVQEEFNDEELQNIKLILLNNVITGLKEIIKIAEELKVEISSENLKHVRWVSSLSSYEGWTQDNVDHVQQLWKDEAIQRAWSNKDKFDLQTIEHLDYIMEKLPLLMKPDYRPVPEDVLRARQRTTGFAVTKFQEGKYEWTLVDVGGQLPERRKWDEIIAKGAVGFIYFVAVDEFNTMSRETNQQKSRLDVSIEVFEQVINNKTNSDLCPILFLNKMDRFKSKIEENSSAFEDFQRLFPDYKGGPHSQVAIKEIEQSFTKVVNEESKEKLIRHHTCALDTESVKVVFVGVREHILELLVEKYF